MLHVVQLQLRMQFVEHGREQAAGKSQCAIVPASTGRMLLRQLQMGHARP